MKAKQKQISERPAKRRSIIRSNPHRTVGGFGPQSNADTPLQWESWLERHTIITLLLCADVLHLATQPEPFSFVDGQQTRSYTPDLLVTTLGGPIWIEVKPLSRLVESGALEYYRTIACAMRAAGRTYAFLTNEQIEIEPRLTTVKRLRRFIRCAIPSGVRNRVGSALSDGPLPVETLIAKPEVTLTDVFALIAQKHLVIDFDRPLNGNTIVSLPGDLQGRLSYARIQNSGRHGGLLESLALGRRPTDQYELAAAAARRPSRRIDNPWAVVGCDAERRAPYRLRSKHAGPSLDANGATHSTGSHASAFATWLEGR